MFQLGNVHLFEVSDLANVDGIPAGLTEHIGANQPLDDNGEPGGQVIPLQREVQDEDHHQGDDVEG